MHASAGFLSQARPRYRKLCAVDLCVTGPAVTTETTNNEVYEVFSKQRGVISLAVTEHERPIGLISRSIFLSQISKPFYRDLYGRKSCIAFMDKDPLVVDAELDIETLSFRAVEFGERALADGFIITREGSYLGTGHGLQLMRCMADLQAEKNQQIMHSIEYASVIQRSMLRVSREQLALTLPDASLVWEPRDIVGGDFYHFQSYPEGWFLALADCTGHGVPGAFMTVISSSALVQALTRLGPQDPALLMAEVNRSIKTVLGQLDGKDGTPGSDDGLDAAFCWYGRESRTLHFAGANSSLLVLRPHADAVETLASERRGVGYVDTPMEYRWSNSELELQAGTLLFATTDGIVDQIGGVREIAFGRRRLREVILRSREASAQAICGAVLEDFARWQGEHRRRDDVTFFCARL